MGRRDGEDLVDYFQDAPEASDRVEELAGIVIDAALEVHRALGPGFQEITYEQALAVELELRAIPFQRQVPVAIKYKGFDIGDGRLDLLVENSLVVELKAVEVLAPVHIAQVLSYLRATHLSLGLLITFNTRLLKQGLRRIVLSR
jgi:GxxExxY protein